MHGGSSCFVAGARWYRCVLELRWQQRGMAVVFVESIFIFVLALFGYLLLPTATASLKRVAASRLERQPICSQAVSTERLHVSRSGGESRLGKYVVQNWVRFRKGELDTRTIQHVNGLSSLSRLSSCQLLHVLGLSYDCCCLYCYYRTSSCMKILTR